METLFWLSFGVLFAIICFVVYVLGRMCWVLYKSDMDFQIPTDEEDFK